MKNWPCDRCGKHFEYGELKFMHIEFDDPEQHVFDYWVCPVCLKEKITEFQERGIVK
jgi:rubredoxin